MRVIGVNKVRAQLTESGNVEKKWNHLLALVCGRHWYIQERTTTNDNIAYIFKPISGSNGFDRFLDYTFVGNDVTPELQRNSRKYSGKRKLSNVSNPVPVKKKKLGNGEAQNISFNVDVEFHDADLPEASGPPLNSELSDNAILKSENSLITAGTWHLLTQIKNEMLDFNEVPLRCFLKAILSVLGKKQIEISDIQLANALSVHRKTVAAAKNELNVRQPI